MKTPETCPRAQKSPVTAPFNKFRVRFMVTACAAIAAGSVLTGKAGNVLVNPGFEAGFSSWTRNATVTWSIDPSTALVRSGSESLWMQGVYFTVPSLTSAYQKIASTPGSTYTADAWFSQYSFDSTHEGGDNGAGSGLFTSDANGNEDGWVEVQFLSSSNTILADYKSVILTPAFVNNLVSIGATVTNGAGNIYLAWIDCQVTNQYDPTTIVPVTDPASDASGITNTLSSGQPMVAPPGTVYVEFILGLFQAYQESGATYWDDCTLNQVGGPSPSVIGNFSPDGSKLFNAATNFTFNVQSASSGGAPLPSNPTNGIQVVVNGVNQSGSLQFTGSPTNWNVALPNLASNAAYNISITVSNSSGLISSASVSFDTFGSNYFVVDSEDYDYNGGLFFQNPIPTAAPAANSYYGLAGLYGTDMATVYPGPGNLPAGAAQLVRSDGSIPFQLAPGPQLPIYIAQGVSEVALSYNNAGNWENYTRNYPAGLYKVYARLSGGAGAGVEHLNLLTSGYGMATQTTTNLGAFLLSNGTDWNYYMWIPLTDNLGNLVALSLPAGQQTLQLLSGGGENFAFFMLVPASSGGVPPVISNFNPPIAVQGQNVFVNTNIITFSVSSATSTIATNKVQTLLNGVDLSSATTFTGNNTNWNVSVPVPPNQLLTLVVNATDASGLSNSVTVTFDTFSQNNFTIEAEDFDFNGGHFIDDPVPTGNHLTGGTVATDSYFYYPGGVQGNAAVVGFDLTTPNTDAGELFNYRPFESCGTDVSTDFLRQKFIGAGVTNDDYYVGWWNAGTWLNYSRTFPTNNYNVYGRLAGGAGPFSGTTLSLVTSGVGTSNQTTQLAGSFADPNAAGWTVWHWVPLLDTNGQLATISLGGVETIKLTSNAGLNANFYIFVPVLQAVHLTASISGTSISLHFPTQTNATYTVLYRSSLTGGTWQAVAGPISGDGTIKTVPITTSGSQGFYRVWIQ